MNNIKNYDYYRCPFCLSELVKDDTGSIKCKRCNNRFPIKDNIPIFSKDPNYYYGEVKKTELQNFFRSLSLSKRKKENFNVVLRDWLQSFPKEKTDYLIKYILEEKRMGGMYLLNLKGTERVLDIGCGWGGFSIKIYPYVKEVHSLDLTLDRLLFLKYRAMHKKFNNIFLTCAGDRPIIPFKDKFFDIIIINGVLEWIPASIKGNPQEVQKNFLKEVRRILKSEGQIYFAIENRFNYKYILGNPDDHSGLKYASLLPRNLANIYSLLARNKPYNTYTYSYGKYIKLLKNTGFKNIYGFSALPNYRYPTKIIPLCRKDIFYKKNYHNYKILIKDKVKNNKLFAHSFIFVNSNDDFHCFVHNILKREFPQNKYSLLDFEITQTGTVFIKAINTKNNTIELAIKLPLNEFIKGRLKSHFKNLNYLRKLYLWSQELFSVPIIDSTLHNQEYFIERYIHGMNGDYAQENDKELLISQAIDIITKIHRETLIKVNFSEFENEINKIFTNLKIFNWRNEQKNILLKIKKFIISNKPSNLFFIFSHNDYCLKNILYDVSSKKIKGILDWDMSTTKGFPLIDILHLIARSKKTGNISLTDSIKRYLPPFSNGFKRYIISYFKSFNIPIENCRLYFIFYILLLLERNVIAWKMGVGGMRNLSYFSVQKEINDLIKILNIYYKGIL